MRKTIFILLFALLNVLSARAYDFEVDGIYYSITNSSNREVWVTYSGSSDNKYSGSVVIPSTVTYEGTTYSVTAIGDDAFAYCSGLTSVTIPKSITSIGDYAFRNCSGLTSVEWNAVACQDLDFFYTSDSPFYNCENITSITFGNQVEHIPAKLCYGMKKITSVTIGENVTSIGYSAFEDCSGLTSVEWNARHCADLPSYTNTYTFSDCKNLATITFGNQVEYIPAYLCYNCIGLTSVTIPESVSKIGLNAFGVSGGHSDLSLYYAGDIAQWCGIEFGKSDWGASWSNGFSLYINNQKVVDLALPDGMAAIEGGPFYNCIGLTSVTIPNSVTAIGDNAFRNCTGLPSVTIPESVTHIGSSAFRGCSGLTSVTIPEGVTFVGVAAFANCTGLTSVEWNAVACQDIHESPGSTLISTVRFDGCENLTDITFGNQVTYIPVALCDGWSKLTTVTIPESVTSIGDYAFGNCTSLTSVTIPESVTKIGSDAFSGCSGLTSVTIPESVTKIGSDAFSGCSGLTSVTIPESVDTIDPYAFYGCTSISSPLYNSKIFAYLPQNYNGEYAIPSGIQTIAGGAFSGCSGLMSVTIPESATSIGWWGFYQCTGLTTVTIPEHVISIGWEAFSGCSGLSSVTIGTGVTTIGYATFADCSGLTTVTIPESVTDIGAYAFGGCSGLTSVTIGKSVDIIGRDAFDGCNNLLSVTSLSKRPPYCGYDMDFGYARGPSFSFYEGTLFVPRGCKMVYQTAREWSEFSIIEELPSMGTATITVRPNDAAMGLVTGGGEYKEGEQAMLAAIPNKGYYFDRWDDGNTNNPRILTVSGDTTITAIFAKNEEYPDDPSNPDEPGEPDNPTPNEISEADNFRVYVQGRTILLSEDRGAVQVYNMAGQCVYNGHTTAIPVSQPGVYIVAVGPQRFKVPVR